ncbi:unnamed protein product [Rodentolepis nana]|uniref:Uncharacterized protein n=1 Tax=Rodentolepis nana TaxID=102285 RepID=A0A0R3TCV5_RODNA|nr:unnamed protein product [Rodentolepis nana]
MSVIVNYADHNEALRVEVVQLCFSIVKPENKLLIDVRLKLKC